jgi:two-component sensor histidine kinase
VRGSDDEPVVPLREARHRMANVFQLLGTLSRLRAQRGDPEGRRQVEWLGEATAALGTLQNRLMHEGGDDFADFLADMAPAWRRRAAPRGLAVEIAAEPLALSEQTASALAVIVHELVANAFAHGFPEGRAGVVRVVLARVDAARACLTVADDGIGYAPVAADPQKLGLWLVGGLADQVKGALSTSTEGGVTVRLEFPAP